MFQPGNTTEEGGEGQAASLALAPGAGGLLLATRPQRGHWELLGRPLCSPTCPGHMVPCLASSQGAGVAPSPSWQHPRGSLALAQAAAAPYGAVGVLPPLGLGHLGRSGSSHFCLTADLDISMKSEINPSDIFFSSKNVAAEIFYRPLELGLAIFFWIEIYPLTFFFFGLVLCYLLE